MSDLPVSPVLVLVLVVLGVCDEVTSKIKGPCGG